MLAPFSTACGSGSAATRPWRVGYSTIRGGQYGIAYNTSTTGTKPDQQTLEGKGNTFEGIAEKPVDPSADLPVVTNLSVPD